MNASGATLIIGGDSAIGKAVAVALRARGGEVVVTSRRPDHPGALFLDLDQPPEEWPVLPACRSVLLAAAMARIPECEADPGGSYRVNVVASVALARRLTALGAYVLFLSTNQVVDGGAAFIPADTVPAPCSVYGRHKAEAEAALLAMTGVGVLRLAKVMDGLPPLFEGWRRALLRGEGISAFTDMTAAPLPMVLVVELIVRLLAVREGGIFQASGDRDLTYFEMAQLLAGALGVDVGLVRGGTTVAAGLPEPPRHTTLDMSRTERVVGMGAPSSERVVRELFKGMGDESEVKNLFLT